MFEFSGSVESSKSLVNRALILQSYEPQIELSYQSQSMDVKALKTALDAFRSGGHSFDAKDAGTTFRFLALRLSREPGKWTLKGSQRLLSRPQQELIHLLRAFGAHVDVHETEWIIQSGGWKNLREITVDTALSSQFLSAVVLNCWNLPEDLLIHRQGTPVSTAYFEMTLQLVRQFGLSVQLHEKTILIPARQKPRIQNLTVEADVSSCFALASCAVQNGRVLITPFPFESTQPDLVFLKIFEHMGIPWSREDHGFQVSAVSRLKPIFWDLTDTPDLFPLLCILCARAEGSSVLTGLSQLVHKESDRWTNTEKLLLRLGRKTQRLQNGIQIEGVPDPFRAEGEFDPDHDHRMAMAAQVANFFGARLKISTPSVVDKSFPQFWTAVGVTP